MEQTSVQRGAQANKERQSKKKNTSSISLHYFSIEWIENRMYEWSRHIEHIIESPSSSWSSAAIKNIPSIFNAMIYLSHSFLLSSRVWTIFYQRLGTMGRIVTRICRCRSAVRTMPISLRHHFPPAAGAFSLHSLSLSVLFDILHRFLLI